MTPLLKDTTWEYVASNHIPTDLMIGAVAHLRTTAMLVAAGVETPTAADKVLAILLTQHLNIDGTARSRV